MNQSQENVVYLIRESAKNKKLMRMEDVALIISLVVIHVVRLYLDHISFVI